MDNKRITIKVWQMCIVLIVLIIVTFAVIFLLKNEKINIKAEEQKLEESKTIAGYDIVNNIITDIEVEMNEIHQDKLNGYVPDQNLVKDNFTPFSEKELETMYNYDISNVILEIEEGSLSKTGMILKIIDNNETKYSWSEDFWLQIKNDDGEWVFPKYIPKNSWYEVPLNLNSDGIGLQTVSMNGEFEDGQQYRIVKRTYDNNKQEYVEVSVEFEI